MTLQELLASFVAGDEREEAERTAMLRLAHELEQPLSRDQPRAHFTARRSSIDADCGRACLVQHVKLGRLLQPGGHVEPGDESLEAAALREAREETGLELRAASRRTAAVRPRHPRDPERPGEPAHLHLDVRFLLVGRGEPCDGAAWYPLGCDRRRLRRPARREGGALPDGAGPARAARRGASRGAVGDPRRPRRAPVHARAGAGPRRLRRDLARRLRGGPPRRHARGVRGRRRGRRALPRLGAGAGRSTARRGTLELGYVVAPAARGPRRRDRALCGCSPTGRSPSSAPSASSC